MRELWIDTWRSIVAHRVRFGLTSLGIAWGAFMLTFLSSNMQGFEQHFVASIERAGPKIIYMGSGTILKSRVGARGAREVELKAEHLERIEKLALVEHASPAIGIWSMPVRAGRRSKLMRISGLDANAKFIGAYEIERGRFLSPTDITRFARVAVLGPGAKERLFGDDDAVGKSIIADGLRFRVVGVLEPKGEQLANSSDPDDLKVIVPYSTALRAFQNDDVIEDLIFSPVTKELGYDAIQRVREVTALYEGYTPDIESAMWSYNIQDTLGMVRGIFLGIRYFMVGAGLITLFVGAVGVMNIMLVVVGERVQEIGVRKALGARSRDIFIQFLAEATVVSGVSGVAGALVGLLLVQFVKFVLPEGSTFITPPLFDPTLVSIVTFALIAVGIVSGAVPALRAAQTPPSEAIRAA